MTSLPGISDRPERVAPEYSGIGGRQALLRLQQTVLQEEGSVPGRTDFVKTGLQSDGILILGSRTCAEPSQTDNDR